MNSRANSENVKRQHYVWRYYIEAWEINSRLYACRNGNIYPTNARGVANERYFYQLNELNENEVRLIKGFIGENNPARENELFYLELFMEPFRIRDKIISEKGEMDDDDQKEILHMIRNYEEKYNAHIEDGAVDIIKSLRMEKLEFWADTDKRARFLHFVFLQYVRTKKMKEKMVRLFLDSGKDFGDFSIERAWGVLRHICAFRIGGNMFDKKSNMNPIFLSNNTTMPFITGDQPVINLHSSSNGPATDVEIYYPISPRVALVLTNKTEKYVNRNVSVDEAYRFNRMIYLNSEEQIFSGSEEILTEIVSYNENSSVRGGQ